jgi:hypothetical protein
MHNYAKKLGHYLLYIPSVSAPYLVRYSKTLKNALEMNKYSYYRIFIQLWPLHS